MSEALSLRETLTAAMNEGAPEAPAAAPEAPVATPETPEAAATPDPAAAEAPKAEEGAQPRGPDGKFAPKTGDAEPIESKTEPAPAAVAEPPQSEGPLRIPSSLPAPLKAKFKDLPEDVRAAFVKLDEDRTAAKAQWDTKAAQFNRYEEIFGPRREQFALRGLDDIQAIKTLFAAQDFLDRDPVAGIAHLARSYGVDLRQFGQQPVEGHQPAPQPGFDPTALQPLYQKVQTLEQLLQQRDQAAAEAQRAQVNAQIEAFVSDPAHIYFDNVKDIIVGLLESEQAVDLKDAYEKAIWASPEVRPLLIQQQQVEQQKAAAAAAAKANAEAAAAEKAKADAARKLSGSVTGSPTPGAVAPAAAPRASIREELLAAGLQG